MISQIKARIVSGVGSRFMAPQTIVISSQSRLIIPKLKLKCFGFLFSLYDIYFTIFIDPLTYNRSITREQRQEFLLKGVSYYD